MDIHVNVDESGIRRALLVYQRIMADLTPVMHAIGQSYEARVVENFARQSDPSGAPWQPLSSLTLQLGLGKLKGGFSKSGALGAAGKRYLQGKQILVASGALRGSIHYQSTPTSVTIGTGAGLRANYAAIHQFGGTIRPKKGKALNIPGVGRRGAVRIPARPYLAMNNGASLKLSERDRQMVMNIIHQMIGDVVEGRK